MTKGRELPVNSKVRRRLFSEDEGWNEDCVSQIVKTEYIARNLKDEVILKGKKWNFDFEREVPLDGHIQWYSRGSSGEWVGMQPSGRTTNMRKRDRDPESPVKSIYEDNAKKIRRLPLYSAVHRRRFFNDARALENAIAQGEDDNFANEFMDNIKIDSDKVVDDRKNQVGENKTSQMLYPFYKLEEEEEMKKEDEKREAVEVNDAITDNYDGNKTKENSETKIEKRGKNNEDDFLNSEDDFETEGITRDCNDMEEQDPKDKPNDMKAKNDDTPRIEREARVPMPPEKRVQMRPRTSEKAKRRLYSSHF